MPLFKTKEIAHVKSIPVDPEGMPSPETAEDFVRRGMAFYARKRYDRAEDDLRQAVSLDPKLVDAHYALGMTLKAAKKPEAAALAFQEVIRLINNGAIRTQTTAEMLRRLALGHVNQIQTGDWNLEKEIWHHV